MRPCKFCAGSGHPGYVVSPGGLWQRCPACDGKGKEPQAPLFYEYEMDVQLTALQANAIATLQINDYDFRWDFAMASSTGAFSALITDGSSKRQFSNVPLNQGVMWGTAEQPFPLRAPFVFPRRGAIIAALTDLSNANNTVHLGFAGVQLIG